MLIFATMNHFFNHTLRLWALFLLMAVQVTSVSAARRNQVKQPKQQQQEADSVRLWRVYMDSLQQVHDSIFNAPVAVQPHDTRFYRLFAPLTFYHQPMANLLDLEDSLQLYNGVASVDSEVENTLFHVYLQRPDLVCNNETQLRKSGALVKSSEKPIKQKMKLTEHTATLPEEPSVAPVGLVITKPNFWSFSGDQSLQFMQNFVSDNWYKGGESNYSMVGSVTLNANYNNKQKLKFDNKLELKLGFQTSRGDTVHKFKTNNDLIRYTGKIGVQAAKRWYYSLQMLAYTQFTQGLKSNDHYVYSDFMSPFNLNFGIGMEYSVQTKSNKLSGSVNLSLLSFNFRYVDRKELAPRYSIKGNHRTREDFGSQVTVDLNWKVSNNVNWRTRFYTYTTYENVLMEWENTISLTVSKYISANIFLYPRFDDSTARDEKLDYLQFKEYSALGFSYAF